MNSKISRGFWCFCKVSESLDGLNVQFGALAFSQTASYVPIQPMPWLDDLGDGLPFTGRDTHWALVRCLSIMRSRTQELQRARFESFLARFGSFWLVLGVFWVC